MPRRRYPINWSWLPSSNSMLTAGCRSAKDWQISGNTRGASVMNEPSVTFPRNSPLGQTAEILQSVRLLEQRPRMAQDLAAGIGQLKSTGLTYEEPYLECLLELSDCDGYRGRRDMHLLRRTRNRPAFGDSDKILKLLEGVPHMLLSAPDPFGRPNTIIPDESRHLPSLEYTPAMARQARDPDRSLAAKLTSSPCWACLPMAAAAAGARHSGESRSKSRPENARKPCTRHEEAD